MAWGCQRMFKRVNPRKLAPSAVTGITNYFQRHEVKSEVVKLAE